VAPLGPPLGDPHENTSHCCRFWSRCGVARFRPVRQRTPSKVRLVAVECPPAMGAQQPKQFRRSKLRRISAVGELISGRDSKAFQMVGDRRQCGRKVSGRSCEIAEKRIDPPARGHLDHVRELAVKGPRRSGARLLKRYFLPALAHGPGRVMLIFREIHAAGDTSQAGYGTVGVSEQFFGA